MAFKVNTEPEALEDIQEGIDRYNKQQPDLGRKFHSEVKVYFKKPKVNPFFQIHYDNVHCLPIKKYPYMIHFTINETDKIVTIKAIFNTSKDPINWKTDKKATLSGLTLLVWFLDCIAAADFFDRKLK